MVVSHTWVLTSVEHSLPLLGFQFLGKVLSFHLLFLSESLPQTKFVEMPGHEREKRETQHRKTEERETEREREREQQKSQYTIGCLKCSVRDAVMLLLFEQSTRKFGARFDHVARMFQ